MGQWVCICLVHWAQRAPSRSIKTSASLNQVYPRGDGPPESSRGLNSGRSPGERELNLRVRTETLRRKEVGPPCRAIKEVPREQCWGAPMYTSGGRGLERPWLQNSPEVIALHLPRAPGPLA